MAKLIVTAEIDVTGISRSKLLEDFEQEACDIVDEALSGVEFYFEDPDTGKEYNVEVSVGIVRIAVPSKKDEVDA
jgi:hypothetical protein